MTPIRLTVVQTHPVQYFAPWFRYITAQCPEIALTVLYASRPTPEQQGTGFGRAFEWDTALFDGYNWTVVRDGGDGDDFASARYRGLDVRGIGRALDATKPDVILVPGWHSVTLVRAIAWARLRGIPVVYRGDSNDDTAPAAWRRPLWHLKTRVLLSAFSGFLAVGRKSRAYLTSHGADPSRVFASPHAVDNEGFAAQAAPHLADSVRAAVRAKLGAGPRDVVVLFAGKLEPRKRPLDAVGAVAALGPDAMLAVAGSGPLDRAMRDDAARRGVRLAPLGFVNQSGLGEVYAAADCLVLPSEFDETWGLVVNEAMATGLPAVVSDRVGCAPDLVVAGETGEVHRAGDVTDLAAALERVRSRGGRTAMGEACRTRAARCGFAAASTGLVAACQSLAGGGDGVRVILCGGGMVIVSGLERMTFEVLRVVRRHGGAVHCIVNGWQNERIVEIAEQIGASWSTGFYGYPFMRPRTPRQAWHNLSDLVRTSAGLARAAWRFAPTHVLLPEHVAVLRNAPSLAVLRGLGVTVVFRMAMAPEQGRLQKLLWRHALSPFVTRFVPISHFSQRRLRERGIPDRKMTLIRNALSRRCVAPGADADVVRLARSRRTILAVGQILPFKGTHLFVEAILQLRTEGFDVQGIVLGQLPTWPAEMVEYFAAMQRRVTEAGAEQDVHFVGIRENVPEIMKASYLLATPVLGDEAFGSVSLEARSVGLPVVTFASGGLLEQVEHGRTGYVCETSDLSGLLAGLRYYLSDPAARDAASANNLADAAAPGNDCTAQEFERRWRTIFAPPAPALLP